MKVTSVKNESVMRYRNLLRKREDVYIPLEGVRLICDAVNAGVQIEQVFCSEACLRSENGIRLQNLIEEFDVPFVEISATVSERMSDTKSPQGAFAIANWTPITCKDMDLGLDKRFVALDGVSDPGNVGTIVRTAAALGFDGVIGGRDCAKFSNPKTLRASMGSVFRTSCYESNALEADIANMKMKGCRAFVADADGCAVEGLEMVLSSFILVIGGEAFGPSKEVLELADEVLSIPMQRGVESLNAGVAAGILMYELMRKSEM